MSGKREKPVYGYPSVESLVFAFIKASHLAPKSGSIYTDVRQLSSGKRRFFSWERLAERRENADDFPGIAKKLEKTLAEEWATPEMATEIASRLGDYIRVYLSAYVRRISAAQLPTSEILANIRLFYFAQRIAVDLSWLEQKWGIGLLSRILPRNSTEANPVGTALKWIRRLEGFTPTEAAHNVGREPVEFEKQMSRWESGRHKPRKDSFALLKTAYGLDKNPRYRLWIWISLLLNECEPVFRGEIASCLGRGFELDAACGPFIQLTNNTIVETVIPECFQTLHRLLCQQAARQPKDYQLALQALQEFKTYVEENEGKAEYHFYAMEARIAVFSKKPKVARELFLRAIALARYAEPTEAERLLRAFAALCVHEGYAVPLKNATDTQWLFGLHPLQRRQPDVWADETAESVTESKRWFDYIRYFPPQSFFDFKPSEEPEDSASLAGSTAPLSGKKCTDEEQS